MQWFFTSGDYSAEDWEYWSESLTAEHRRHVCPEHVPGWDSKGVSFICKDDADPPALPDLGCGPGNPGISEGKCDCAGNVDLGCGCGSPGPSGCDKKCGSTAIRDKCGICGGEGILEGKCDCNGNVDEGCGCGKKCVNPVDPAPEAGWTQDWICKTNQAWQLLPEENDTY